mgnify:CR=1 FL=1
MHYKKTLIGLTIVLGLLITTIARAEGETKKIETFGTKVSNHISTEIENTKEFQKKKWAETKAQFSRLFSKFQAKD